MNVYIVIIISLLIIIAGFILYIILKKTRECEKCDICESETIMKLDYDYNPGEKPAVGISDFTSTNKDIEKQAGENWKFLWA